MNAFPRPCCVAWSFFALTVLGQTSTGELRLTITDATGLVVQGSVELSCEANAYRNSFEADSQGRVLAKRLPFGLYRVHVRHAGFADTSELVDIRSAIPKELTLVLMVAQAQASVTVKDNETLLDPYRSTTAYRIGSAAVQERLPALPGRDLSSLVVQQPGWVLEANGILHPRASEYQTQYVMDGIPLTDNRSAAYTADFDAGHVQEMTVMTAGYPAEYGRKLGGVVEVQTTRDTRPGFHAEAVASGGNFDTANAFLEGQYGWGANTLSASLAGATTDRFLDPPVTQNYTNHGTLNSLMVHYERDLDANNRLGVILFREQSKFLVPNELIQQAAGQRQDRNNFESAAEFSFTHIFSSNVLADFRAMARDITATYWSNDLSTPMIASQDRSYREAYVKATVSAHMGNHEFKVGSEADFAGLDEALGYLITDPSQFDPNTPLSFQFYGRGRDREQAVFAQDMYRWKNLTLTAGLRFDHYSLLVNQFAWSPRLGVAYYWPRANMVFRACYDRIFQTPAFENLLVSSSPDVVSLSPENLRLPVKPSRGNYYEAGFGRAFFGKLMLNTNFYRRNVTNYADDDLLLNTGVSFPIAFAYANIQGVEVKLEIANAGPFSGYISWSNEVGTGFLPVTGGLFLGDDATNAATITAGSFPVSQDQRNTLRARFRYQLTKRMWAAVGGTYDSGLPVEYDGTYEDAVAQYGLKIVDRVNFSAGRARPGFTLNASYGINLIEHERSKISLQVHGTNLTNQLNVINFAGLFSGTALAAPRSITARLQMLF